MRSWLLPEHVEDVLPHEAEGLERLRRTILDHLMAAGYRIVQPPMVEHLESLLTGSARDLDLLTFKIVDPLSGRMLGVRADITPQVARIDAHLLNAAGVNRLCYAGNVLRATPVPPAMSREVMQVGAELYGEPSIAGDNEAIGLMLSSLTAAGLPGLHLDLGHVGVYRALVNASGSIGGGDDDDLFNAMRVKDVPGVVALTTKLAPAWRHALCALPLLYGPADEVLARARGTLPDVPAVANALSALESLAHAFGSRVEALHVDLADLRGYHYHNGPIFSAFVEDEPNAVGNGGRYDGVGKAFGKIRPATGFTLDLRQLFVVLTRTAS
ncbi:MAG TPA: ATP phosphoribosyltransferase regulatory subunit [Casimicrobiaceae bacterium]|nr:ATP phosphoribosyltransferase regulatory subunit [Casimicrobiaceae bacterium]